MDCLCGRELGTNKYCSYCREFRETMHIMKKEYDSETRRPYKTGEDLT